LQAASSESNQARSKHGKVQEQLSAVLDELTALGFATVDQVKVELKHLRAQLATAGAFSRLVFVSNILAVSDNLSPRTGGCLRPNQAHRLIDQVAWLLVQ
jgi:hypothetical protein